MIMSTIIFIHLNFTVISIDVGLWVIYHKQYN